jgi:hypothetical protein
MQGRPKRLYLVERFVVYSLYTCGDGLPNHIAGFERVPIGVHFTFGAKSEIIGDEPDIRAELSRRWRDGNARHT